MFANLILKLVKRIGIVHGKPVDSFDLVDAAPVTTRAWAVHETLPLVTRECRSVVTSSPLPKKLGIKPGARVALVGAPEGFLESTLEPLPDEVELRSRVRGPLDVIVFFTKSRSDLERRFGKLAAALEPAGGLWIAWPKRSSGVETDLTEETLREIGLPQGLVDNKVCAIDERWSGLRFVIRKENR